MAREVYMERVFPSREPGFFAKLFLGSENGREPNFLEESSEMYEDVVESTEDYDLPELEMASKVKMSRDDTTVELEEVDEMEEALEDGYELESGSMEIVAGELDEAGDVTDGEFPSVSSESPLHVKVDYPPANSWGPEWMKAYISVGDDRSEELSEEVAYALTSHDFRIP